MRAKQENIFISTRNISAKISINFFYYIILPEMLRFNKKERKC